MEKFCPLCRQSNPAEAAFCRHCAAPLTQAQAMPPQATATQPNPGNQQWNQPQAANPIQGFQPQQMTPAAQNNRPMIAVGLVVAGLICCGPFTSIPGAIMGWMEVTAIKEGRSDPGGMTLANIAFWGGIVVTIITIIGWLLFLLLSMMGGGY